MHEAFRNEQIKNFGRKSKKGTIQRRGDASSGFNVYSS